MSTMPRPLSIYPASSSDEYMSPFTAPAMPNVRTLGVSSRIPMAATADPSRVPPRSPLPPHKLAKLANALGVSTPLPALNPSLSHKRSFSARPAGELAVPEPRSATPSAAAGRQPTSRYLIHVVPPKHFPHESRKDPKAFASFRRGSLVPLHASLKAQLSAICREYQLPTTQGLVLYLVGESDSNEGRDRRLGKGPRISEDVWKWLWMKIADEQPILRGVGLGLSSGASSPAPSENPNLLRSLSLSPRVDTFPRTAKTATYPLTPSPSSPSSSSPSTSVSTSIPTEPSGAAALVEQSNSSQLSNGSPTPDTPASSLDSLDPRFLPGLGSSSLMPVLAKVEFDVDRKVGTWYNTWSRSRKIMQKRRGKGVDSEGKLQLRITINDKTGAVSPPSSPSDEDEEGYERFGESPDEFDTEAELTARASPRRRDPLADVFGTDGEEWSNMQSERPRRKAKGDLALDGAALSALPDLDDADSGVGVSDREEVMALWNARNHPQLRGALPRKGAPPPLNLSAHGEAGLKINIATATPSPYSAGFDDESVRLPYLRNDSQSSNGDDMYKEKRIGGIYEDLDLDLNADIDMDEHRASQLRIRQELDVLERNLAQFSPRALKSAELPSEQISPTSPNLRSPPPQRTSAAQSLRAGSQQDSRRIVPTINQMQPVRPSMMETEVEGPVFKQPVLVGTPSPIADSFRGTNRLDTASSPAEGNHMLGTQGSPQAAWPAVPFAAIAGQEVPTSPVSSSVNSNSTRLTNSPPKVILNGKTKGISSDKRNNSSVSSMLSNGSGPRKPSESQTRSRQYEEEAGFYPEVLRLPPSLSRKTLEVSESPVLPLSPDPFGRFPSSEQTDNVPSLPERTTSLAKHTRMGSKTPSSRFSADSISEEVTTTNLKVSNSRSNLVSMKSIRKLWRKSNKASISSQSISASPDPSTMPSRPPSSVTSVQETETNGSRTPSPSVPFSSGVPPQASVRGEHSRPDSGLDPFYFDQDSKYPIRGSPSPPDQYQFPKSSRPSTPSAFSSVQSNGATPTPEKKRAVRKSLMKWKSGSEASSQSTDSVTEVRRRRPSLLDMAGLMRGSISSTTNMQSPSVPELPAEYRMSQHLRGQSRGSETASPNVNGRTNSMRRKPAPQLSTDSSQESAETIATPVSSGSPLSFPNGNGVLVSPGSSDDVRSSFDESQFEIVAPKTGHMATSVSYSYKPIDRKD
ncbi:hypothetical protein DFH11DRAFT_1721885 [Phellopilus nigrolimitatus]|nr:hypothetical protein DFH11DRAFT_1721885 [Phellopilus nigrolimitatus]